MRSMARAAAAFAAVSAALVLIAPPAPLAAPAPAPPLEARLKIDVDRVIGDVHPLLFGNFAEHLGVMGAGSSARCQGGLRGFDEHFQERR